MFTHLVPWAAASLAIILLVWLRLAFSVPLEATTTATVQRRASHVAPGPTILARCQPRHAPCAAQELTAALHNQQRARRVLQERITLQMAAMPARCAPLGHSIHRRDLSLPAIASCVPRGRSIQRPAPSCAERVLLAAAALLMEAPHHAPAMHFSINLVPVKLHASRVHFPPRLYSTPQLVIHRQRLQGYRLPITIYSLSYFCSFLSLRSRLPYV